LESHFVDIIFQFGLLLTCDYLDAFSRDDYRFDG